MAQLRKAVRGKLLAELDASVLTMHAFEVEFDSEENTVVRIVFRDQSAFRFAVKRVVGMWETEECPGEYFADETSTSRFESIDDALDRVRPWRERIEEELSTHPHAGRGAQFREDFEKALESMSDPDVPFSHKEAEEWRQRLDSALQQIERMHEEQKVDRGELFALRRDVDQIKNAAESLPKKSLVRAAATRIAEYVDSKFDLAIKTAIEVTIRQH
jgi:hypothetical protein